jgi:hypothetical protein
MTPSKAYVQHLFAGPFPGQIDPWAEDAHYFQQIHAGMIDQLLQQVRTPLAEMGYRVGREASLQIADNREPDIFVHRMMKYDAQPHHHHPANPARRHTGWRAGDGTGTARL